MFIQFKSLQFSLALVSLKPVAALPKHPSNVNLIQNVEACLHVKSTNLHK
jgi:hypothetical protein